jgi:histidinol dehydrogenase
LVKDHQDYVTEIIKGVRENGDQALIAYTKKFDLTDLDVNSLKITKKDIQRSYSKVSKDRILAIRYAKKRIENFQKDVLKRVNFTWNDRDKGVIIRNVVRPIESVGCYVPGGDYPYPSSLLMSVIPAKVAHVPRIVVCSPPKKNQMVDPLVLVAADICGINEIYQIGGAQAISALAYGTKTISPVKKIVGPGNKYVTTAKILISKEIAIDMPAGPSELVILADDSANPLFIALDLISQLEHSKDSISCLITNSIKIANEVVLKLESGIPKNRVKQNFEKCYIIVYKSISDAIDFINTFAPEHLEIMCKNADNIISKISSAGLILVGPYTPVSASDYCLGTNHILPTGGFAKMYSSLSAIDFVKRVSIVKCDKKSLRKMTKPVNILANSEGFSNHALALEKRFQS